MEYFVEQEVNYLEIDNFYFQKNEDEKVWDLLQTSKNIKLLTVEVDPFGVSFEHISTFLRRNSSIITLHLKFKELKEKDAKLIGKGINKNKSLKGLYLEGKKFKAQEANILMEYIKASNISILSIEKNIENEACFIIGEMVKSNHNIKELHLLDSNIRYSIQELGKNLENHPSLTNIFLQKITSLGLNDFLKSISKIPKLTSFSLKNSNLEGTELENFCYYFQNHLNLTYLDLSFNSFEFKHFNKLSSYLSSNKKLKYLNLSGIYLYSLQKSFDQIVKGIIMNNTLEELALSANELSLEECVLLRNILIQNNSITSLDLSDNLIDSKGLEIIIDGLNENTKILDIDLSINQITSGSLVFDLLKSNSTLQSLSLSFNPLEQIHLIAEGIYFNTSLVSLTLSSISISENDIFSFQENLLYNYQLKNLEIDVQDEQISRILERNKVLPPLLLKNISFFDLKFKFF